VYELMRTAGLAHLENPVDPTPGNDFPTSCTFARMFFAGEAISSYAYDCCREYGTYAHWFLCVHATPQTALLIFERGHTVKFSTHDDRSYANDVTMVTLGKMGKRPMKQLCRRIFSTTE
jgi:hypothetical protein